MNDCFCINMAFLETQNQQLIERFSLLLLEPGEIYFEDFSAFCCDGDAIPANGIPTLDKKGRLKICSKSVIYDPKDKSLPILKFLYRDVLNILKWQSKNRFEYAGECVLIEVDQYVEMKANNHIAPYTFHRGKKKFVLTLEFCNTDACIPQMCQLQRASTLPIADQTAMINAIVIHRQGLLKFDTSWLGNFYENQIYETQCDRITPLVTNPGRVMLTSEQLYFQAFNNIDPVPVIKVKLAHIKSLIKRRFILRSTGLEIYCRENSSVQHLYLAFHNQSSRDEMYEYIKAQENTKLDDTQQQNLTLMWQNGAISNFDYLSHLNSLADRSINDLTQYPVFPWVVTDFTSPELDLTYQKTFRDLKKPIGALNPERLERLLERFSDMPEPKFLYGSHYSTPGYVLFYLVRIAPEYMLCLQNGRFDQPDRMFNCLQDAWKNCLTSYSDFKELIPEFYEGDGEFLKNSQGIEFGQRQDGSAVGEVELPPWAKDPQDFVHKLREALESDYVSENLHHWIDLIFGYKQKGEEAEKAHNLFFYLTYEGAVEIDQVTDLNERAALEQQIMEFGQTPKQLFTTPHPCKLPYTEPANKNPPLLSRVPDSESANLGASQCAQTLEQNDVIDSVVHDVFWNRIEERLETGNVVSEHNLHKDGVTCVAWDDKGENVYSVGKDGQMKLYSVISQKQSRSVNVINTVLSSMLVLEDLKTVMVAGWDNNLHIHSLEYGRELNSHYAHDDSITCMCLMTDQSKLLTGSCDAMLKLWQYSGKPGYQIWLVGEMEQDSSATYLCSTPDNSTVAVGTQDGTVTLWDLNTQAPLHQFQAHDGAVNCLKLTTDGQRLLSSGEDRVIKITDVQSGAPVVTKYTPSSARWLEWNETTVLAGLGNGSLEVWDLHNSANDPLAIRKMHQSAINCGALHESGLVATGGEDRTVSVLNLSAAD